MSLKHCKNWGPCLATHHYLLQFHWQMYCKTHSTGSVWPLFRGLKHLIKCNNMVLSETPNLSSSVLPTASRLCAFSWILTHFNNNKKDFMEWFRKRATEKQKTKSNLDHMKEWLTFWEKKVHKETLADDYDSFPWLIFFFFKDWGVTCRLFVIKIATCEEQTSGPGARKTAEN